MKKHAITLDGRGDICARSSTRSPFEVPDQTPDIEGRFEAELLAALAGSELEVSEEALAN
jgi:hypothetical protein